MVDVALSRSMAAASSAPALERRRVKGSDVTWSPMLQKLSVLGRSLARRSARKSGGWPCTGGEMAVGLSQNADQNGLNATCGQVGFIFLSLFLFLFFFALSVSLFLSLFFCISALHCMSVCCK